MSPQICKISRFRVNNLLKDNEKEEFWDNLCLIMMVDGSVVETKNLKKGFTCNIGDKEKERRSIWRKNHT